MVTIIREMCSQMPRKTKREREREGDKESKTREKSNLTVNGRIGLTQLNVDHFESIIQSHCCNAKSDGSFAIQSCNLYKFKQHYTLLCGTKMTIIFTRDLAMLLVEPLLVANRSICKNVSRNSVH